MSASIFILLRVVEIAWINLRERRVDKFLILLLLLVQRFFLISL
jgi:hypothetical protein